MLVRFKVHLQLHTLHGKYAVILTNKTATSAVSILYKEKNLK